MQVTEPRRRPVRRPGPSQIKMYGFCRPFRAMSPAGPQSNQNVWVLPPISRKDEAAVKFTHCCPSLSLCVSAFLGHQTLKFTRMFSFSPGHQDDVLYFSFQKMTWIGVVPTSCACSQLSSTSRWILAVRVKAPPQDGTEKA